MRTITRRAGAVAAMLALTAACGSGGTSGGTQDADGKITVPIGVSLALSGQYASVGQSFREAIEHAVDAYPYKNFKPEMTYEDNRLDNGAAVQVFTKFASQAKVPVVLGGFAGPSIAVAPVADRTRTVYINPLAPTDKLAGHEYLFNTLPMTSEEMRTVAKAMWDAGHRKIGVVFAPDIDGGSATDVLAETFTRLGGTVAERQSVAADAVDFSSQVAKLKDADPDAIFGFAAYSVFAQVAKQIREAGVDVPLWSYRGFGEPTIFTIAKEAVEGTKYSDPSYSLDGTPEAAAATRKYREKHASKDPGAFFTSMYDATWVALSAIDAIAGETKAAPTGEDVKKLFDSQAFEAPYTGTTRFLNSGPERGTVKKPFALFEARDGAFVRVETLEPVS
ncbi:ABC transporter substrate-binding protein [Nonomuraea sp. C10]|uniref:ABC transporter substrate-binding protein n=1 Tax=Nonomuraea sp. C10 TaxID=2600577 RepID=UPI0011CD4AB6|nr:penicillin-binding protein activator [Nonomuraea sp. C10]TXK40098.1 amino acid ABC transporter substrate-binding protein [Nonomuraea sp. C10]